MPNENTKPKSTRGRSKKSSDGEPAHINAKCEHLPITRMSEKKFEIARPRAFVNKARKTRKCKKKINGNVHHVILLAYKLN